MLFSKRMGKTKVNIMKKFILAMLSLCVASFAAIPHRIGPVSAYGALGTNGSKIISQKTGEQVMLRGMSLFWSDAVGSPYYNGKAIAWAADRLGMDVFRFAMGIEYYDSDGGTQNRIVDNDSYKSNPAAKIAQVERMIEAAIESDVYIIIDWHSHRAQFESDIAKDFFQKMAAKYADVPNIIWEVYNEPMTDMGTIANYANNVIGAIRQAGSSNLAIVGTPSWSQMGSCDGVNQTNIAYVFHFYAASHPKSRFQSNIDNCLSAGKAVFVSEWGVTSADGNGAVSTSEASNWTQYMDQKMLPNCNWSFRHNTIGTSVENSAMFNSSSALNNSSLLDAASYTESGKFVKDYLVKNKRNWADIITAGKRSGACAFDHSEVSELDGSLPGVAKAGCTYTSSNEAVAVVENGTIIAKSVGVAIMTAASDGTQSVVTVVPIPDQTVGGISDYACTYADLQKSGTCTSNYSGTSNKERQLVLSTKTDEGSEITCESDNPAVITVSKGTCTGSSCYNKKGTEMWFATFTGTIGSANIHISAPAAPGYKAIDTTVVVALVKSPNRLNPAVFKDTVVALGGSLDILAAECRKVPVTYTISPEGFASQVGTQLVAGNKDGVITITASSEEAETYAAVDQSITVRIGTGGGMTGIVAERIRPSVGLNGYVHGSSLILNVKHSGEAKILILGMDGRSYGELVKNLSAGTNVVPLGSFAKGNYVIRVDHASVTTIPWSNK